MMGKNDEKLLAELIKKIKQVDLKSSASEANEILLHSVAPIVKIKPNLDHPDNPLSITETLCMILLANGCNPEKSADLLGISAKSIKTYEQRIRDKLGARNRIHAFYLALTNGFLSIINS